MTTESDTDVTREPFKTFDTIHRAFRERFQTGDVVVANRGVSVMVWTGDTERAALVFSASASTPQDMVRGLGLTSHPALLAEGEVAHLRTALDAVTHTHERDLLRLAKALGFTHEPPSDVDAMVAAVERLAGERNRAIVKAQQLARILADTATTQDAVELLSAALLQDAASAPNCMEWRGDYGGRGFSVSVQWADGQSPHALIDEARRERDEARAILEGRTTPPTREEVDRHFVEHGGRWLVSRVQVRTCVLDETVTMPLALLVVNAGRWVHASIPGTDFGGRWDDDPFRLMDGATWIPLSADGLPTERPVVTP